MQCDVASRDGSVLTEGLGPNAPAKTRDPHRGGCSYEASMLRNLLARIHRDGGHYVEQHGLETALDAADAKVLELLVMQESLTDTTQVLQFLTDVVTAAGLLSCGKTDKKLAQRISDGAYALRMALGPNARLTGPQRPAQE